MQNPYDIPGYLNKALRDVEATFYPLISQFHPEDFRRKKKEWEDLYEKYLRAQKSEGRRLHKGGPLHNIGLIEMIIRNFDDAFKYFVYGYSEDLISKAQGFLAGSAEEAPGGRALKEVFAASEQLFEYIKTEVKSRTDSILEPTKDLKGLANKVIQDREVSGRVKDFYTNQFLKKRFSINNNIPGPWNERVFIGGSYAGHRIGTLVSMKEAVEQKKFTPVLAYEFTDNEPGVHDHSLILLHNCKYAIFDVTADSGYLMEAERTLDYSTKSLFVYENAPEARMTEMITSMKKDEKALKEFKNKEELVSIVHEFLETHRSS